MSDKLSQAELLQVLISNAVEKGISSALQKELQPLKEELTKVKAITAKILKEGVSANPAPQSSGRLPLLKNPTQSRTQQIAESAAESGKDMYQELKARGVGAGYAPSGELLPDIDIPVPFIGKRL